MTEEWRASLNGYSVSSLGRVRNRSGVILKGTVRQGYLRVKPFGSNGKKIHVHELVAAAFLGPCPAGYEVDHGDQDKLNNRADNLEYVVHQENCRRASLRRSYSYKSGYKLTLEDRVRIRERVRNGETKVDVARDFGISDTHVLRIVRGDVAWANV